MLQRFNGARNEKSKTDMLFSMPLPPCNPLKTKVLAALSVLSPVLFLQTLAGAMHCFQYSQLKFAWCPRAQGIDPVLNGHH
jgi:hypothetical protein